MIGRELLASGDIAALTSYAIATARAWQLDRDVEVRGVYPDGRLNRSVSHAALAHGSTQAWAVTLGLAPSTRRATGIAPTVR